MTCREARQYIFAFLDNELDSALSLEIQQHIEHCPECARECEIENVVHRRLADGLQGEGDLPAIDETAILRNLRREPAIPTSARWRFATKRTLATAGALAAALLVAATAFLVNRTGEANRIPFADALVNDFDHFVTENKPLQILSEDANEVSQWLRDRTTLAAIIPAIDPTLGSLLGGRQCKINGERAAFAVYRVDGELASLVAVRASDDSLAHMKRIDRNGHPHWVDQCRGHTVLACRRGELIYAVVSRLPEESLLPLMPPIGG